MSAFKSMADLMNIKSEEGVIIHKPHVSNIIKGLELETDLGNLRNKLQAIKAVIAKTKPLVDIPPAMDSTYTTYKTSYLDRELKQIEEAQTLERAKYYLKRFHKGLLEEKTNKFSDINLNRWKEYEDIMTDSLWIINKRDSSGIHNAGYWGNFIPQIPNQLIRRYTKQGDIVIDPFNGSGTTVIEAQRLGRHCVGIELQPRMVDYAKNLLEKEPNHFNCGHHILCGDSRQVNIQKYLRNLGQQHAQMVIMHPPYYDIIKFSSLQEDLSNANSLDSFISLFMDVFDNISQYLEQKRFLAIVIGDKYYNGEWIPLGFLTMQEVLKRSFTLKSIVVKNFEDTTAKRQQKELWNYRALQGGFYIFKHEYIFIFQKND